MFDVAVAFGAEGASGFLSSLEVSDAEEEAGMSPFFSFEVFGSVEYDGRLDFGLELSPPPPHPAWVAAIKIQIMVKGSNNLSL